MGLFDFISPKNNFSDEQISYMIAFEMMVEEAINLKSHSLYTKAMYNETFDFLDFLVKSDDFAKKQYLALCNKRKIAVNNHLMKQFTPAVCQDENSIYLMIRHPEPTTNNMPIASAICIKSKHNQPFTVFSLCYSPVRATKTNIRKIVLADNGEKLNLNIGEGAFYTSPLAFSQTLELIGSGINIDNAIKKFKETDDLESKVIIAQCANIGLFMKRDLKLSTDLYLEAAKLGHSQALCEVGKMLYHEQIKMSNDKKENIKQMISYLSQSIQLGNIEAEFYLSTVYLYMTNNTQKGMALLYSSAKKGHVAAGQLLLDYGKNK